MFISFEGIEGAGKSTVMEALAAYLADHGLDPVLTREPGGCNLGRSLRSILLDGRTRGLSSRAELFLFLADLNTLNFPRKGISLESYGGLGSSSAFSFWSCTHLYSTKAMTSS